MVRRKLGSRALAALFVLMVLAACSGGSPPEDGFETAMATCRVGDDPSDVRIDDGGSQLRINNKGEQDNSGISLDDVWCLLEELDTPERIVDLMITTSASDGEQEDAWGGYSVIWTYHPHRGLDVFINR